MRDNKNTVEENSALLDDRVKSCLAALQEYLRDHEATILRSNSAKNELVLSIKCGDSFHEVTFKEDIDLGALKYGWYEISK